MIIPKLTRSKLWARYPGLVSSRTRLENRLRFLSTHIPDEESSFGSYSVILPEEPFVWGVSHITPRTVPSSIRGPPYAQKLAGDRPTSHASTSKRLREPYEDRIRLGSEDETKLRASAKLARNVRKFAGTLIRVGMVLKAWSMDGMMTPSFI